MAANSASLAASADNNSFLDGTLLASELFNPFTTELPSLGWQRIEIQPFVTDRVNTESTAPYLDFFSQFEYRALVLAFRDGHIFCSLFVQLVLFLSERVNLSC